MQHATDAQGGCQKFSNLWKLRQYIVQSWIIYFYRHNNFSTDSYQSAGRQFRAQIRESCDSADDMMHRQCKNLRQYFTQLTDILTLLLSYQASAKAQQEAMKELVMI